MNEETKKDIQEIFNKEGIPIDLDECNIKKQTVSKDGKITPNIQQEITGYYKDHEIIQQKIQKTRAQLEDYENRQYNMEYQMEKTLPTTISILTDIPLEDIKVNAYEMKIWIKHEDKIRLLDIFRMLITKLPDTCDIRCYIEKRCILIQKQEEEI